MTAPAQFTSAGYDCETPALLMVRVRGLPVPQGSMKTTGRPGGRAVLVHSNAAKLKPWRLQLQAEFEAALPEDHVPTPHVPYMLMASFTLPKPMSAPKRRRVFPWSTPDLDKLLRAVGDALEASGAIRNDAQIIETHGVKVYPGEGGWSLPVPGAFIGLWRVL